MDVPELAAAKIVAAYLEGREEPRDVETAPDGTHDFDVVLKDERRVALEVTSAADHKRLAFDDRTSHSRPSGTLDKSGILDEVTDPFPMQQTNVLDGLREAHDQVQRNQEKVRRLVAAAREYGISWQEIGSVLGVSKQAAWERFGKNGSHPPRNRPPTED